MAIERVNGRPFIPGHLIGHNGAGWKQVRADGKWIDNDVYTTNPTVFSTVVKPGVEGMIVVYPWRLLEPERRRYELGLLEAHVEYLEQNHPDVGLVIQINDRSYPSAPANPLPDWIAEAGYAIPCERAGAGVVSARWVPRVADALIDLHGAVCERLGGSPVFAGTATGETAVGISDAQAKAQVAGYTPPGYANALRMICTAIASANPRSRLWFLMNFLQGQGGQALLHDLVLEISAEPWGVAIGGPDVLPNNDALVRQTYGIYRSLPANRLRFCWSQYVSFEHRKPNDEGFYTPAEIAAYARDELGVHALAWNNSGATKPYTIDDAYPVIARTPMQPLPESQIGEDPCAWCGRSDQLPDQIREYLEDEFSYAQSHADRIRALLELERAPS